MNITLEKHLRDHSGSLEDLQHLISALAEAAKLIRRALNMEDLGRAGTTNSTGDDQLALDVAADQIVMDQLRASGLVSHAASEEQEGEVFLADSDRPYSVAYDPLDGSSLVDTNFAVGSIFSIYPKGGFVGRIGRDQAAALYAVYGPRTTLVYSTGRGIHEFTLNDSGEFILAKENIMLKPTAQNFAPGNLRVARDNPKYKALIDGYIARGLTLRYSGGMVPDLNYILTKGEGIFTFPPRPPQFPDGKLRLLFECAPLAFLFEQAGGLASDGSRDILDIEIRDLHQKSPLYVGSKNEVLAAVRAME